MHNINKRIFNLQVGEIAQIIGLLVYLVKYALRNFKEIAKLTGEFHLNPDHFDVEGFPLKNFQLCICYHS